MSNEALIEKWKSGTSTEHDMKCLLQNIYGVPSKPKSKEIVWTPYQQAVIDALHTLNKGENLFIIVGHGMGTSLVLTEYLAQFGGSIHSVRPIAYMSSYTYLDRWEHSYKYNTVGLCKVLNCYEVSDIEGIVVCDFPAVYTKLKGINPDNTNLVTVLTPAMFRYWEDKPRGAYKVLTWDYEINPHLIELCPNYPKNIYEAFGSNAGTWEE